MGESKGAWIYSLVPIDIRPEPVCRQKNVTSMKPMSDVKMRMCDRYRTDSGEIQQLTLENKRES